MHDSEVKNQGSIMVFLGMALGALGIVYGDIGTSPLYAINEIFFGHGNTAVTVPNVYGAISLVVWALSLVITIKYISFVLRADFKGEGGVFSLFSILKESATKRKVMFGVLILAAGLLFGEGIITPAISVLSAVEGLNVINPAFGTFIIPITIGILTLLFMFQRWGTKKIGKIFGPVMLVWFSAIAILGVMQISSHPEIFYALNPYYGFKFILSLGIFRTMVVLGSVVLVITGGEALFADLGHFGIKPIRFGWIFMVYPALLLNYFGQGAFLLGRIGGQSTNIFYGMVPTLFLYPMVILATLATIIASQALITGVFSLISQAMVIGLVPKLNVKHTNAKQHGQIYISSVNWILYAFCIELVLIFKTSAGLAAAYGLAVSGVMLSTSLAMIPIAIEFWRWTPWKAYLLFGGFAIIDIIFLSSNALKFLDGGYVPVLLGVTNFVIMNIWLWGRSLVLSAYSKYTDNRNVRWLCNLKKLLTESKGYLYSGYNGQLLVESDRVMVFIVSDPIFSDQDRIPVALRIYMKRTGSLPRHLIFLHVDEKKIPYVLAENRFHINSLGDNIFSVKSSIGFMEKPDVRQLLMELNPNNIIAPDLDKSVIIVDREQFFIDKNASWYLKFQAAIFRLTLKFGVRTHKYLGLSTEDGLFEIEVPIHIGRNGAGITHPEFDLHYMKTSEEEMADELAKKPA